MWTKDSPELTLVNRDVCAVTAEKGVCSGSGASMVGMERRVTPEEQCEELLLNKRDISSFALED